MNKLNNLNNVKADVLSLKQSYAAVESARSSEIQSLKSTVLSLNVDLNKLSTTVFNAVTNIGFAAQRIESDKSLGVANLRTEIRLLKDSVRDIQDSLYNVNNVLPNMNTGKSKKSTKKAKVVQTSDASGTISMADQSNDSATSNMHECLAGETNCVSASVVQKAGVVVHNDHDSSGWLRTGGDHHTAEPHLSNIRLNVTSGVGSGHAVPVAQDSAQHGVGDSEGSSVADDPYIDSPNPLVNTNGAERSSSVLGTGRQSHEKDSSLENHFPPRDTQPYSYKDSLANVRSTGQSNAVSERASSNIYTCSHYYENCNFGL